MNSFIGWIGGKKLLRKEIIKRFPLEYDKYIEVFGGAGWVLFGKEEDNRLEIFNDLNSDLINLYRCIKYHSSELIKELEWYTVSREYFKDCKEQLNMRGLTDIQRAARYFFIIKLSFGSAMGQFGVSKKMNLQNSIHYIEKIKSRLKTVIIENDSFEKIIKKYDKPSSLFYLDPPYYGTESHYDIVFDKEQHIKLKEILDNMKGKFILSYNNCEFIKELYSDYQIEYIERNNNLTSKNDDAPKRYKEIIIKNY